MVYYLLPVVLWLVSAIPLTTQDAVELSVTPVVTVACGESVTLQCNVTSSQDGLRIKHLAWIHSFVQAGTRRYTPLCHVTPHGDATGNSSKTTRDVRCNYSNESLALTVHAILPLAEGTYICKLRSNKGIGMANTTVTLQEFSGEADVNVSSKGVSCTFKGIRPEGEVHWFHGSANLTGSAMRTINGAPVEESCPDITSTLPTGESNSHLRKPYNCSLWDPRSGRYITSRLVHIPETQRVSGGAEAQGPLWTTWGFLLSSAFLMKQ